MIDANELAICRRRGHGVRADSSGWQQCPWCGVWLVERCRIEEQENEPPENELSPRLQTKRHLDELRKTLPPDEKR